MFPSCVAIAVVRRRVAGRHVVRHALQRLREGVIGPIPANRRDRRLHQFLLRKVVLPLVGLNIYISTFLGLIVGGTIHRFVLFPDRTPRDDWTLTAAFLAGTVVALPFSMLVTTVAWLRGSISRRGPERAMRFLVNPRWARQPPKLRTRLLLWLSGVDWYRVLMRADFYGIREKGNRGDDQDNRTSGGC